MPLFELGEGVYTTESGTGHFADFLDTHKNAHNVTIRGKGAGVSQVQGKIKLTKWFPDLRDFAMYPGNDTDWSMIQLDNPGRFRIDGVEVHPAAGQTGLVVRTTDGGVVDPWAGDSWPARNNPNGGARISVSELRSFYAYGAGKGCSFLNEVTVTAPKQFTNHVRIDGGHIVTDDTAMLFGPLASCVVRNFHIDVANSNKGLRWGEDSKITWYAPGYVEPGYNVKQEGGQYLNGPMENLTIIGDWPRSQMA